MVNSIEHIRLYSGVMYHVLKDDSLPYLQLMVETPQSHIVAAQAGVSSKAIDVRARIAHLRSTHCRLIGHLQTIRHVARKANVENGGTNAAVFQDVHYIRAQHTGLSSKSGTGLKNDLKMWIAPLQALQQTDKMLYIIILTRHQMPAS